MPLRAAIYCRISDDREGRGLGVARQEEDCRRRAEFLGWEIAQVYADNDISAFKGKARPEYNLMLDDISAGRIDALICWHTDRLHRNVRELLDFLDVVNERDRRNPASTFSIQTVQAGQLDLATPTGRAVAITFGAWAEQESAHKAKRIRRKVVQLVEEGKVHNGGPRPFGYTRIYAGEGPRRKIIHDEINEEEAAIIRECAKRVLSSETLRSVVRDLNDRGIKTSMGNPWTMQAMRWMLRSGRIAGLKEFHREIVGEAAWPSIIDRETHEQIRALLDSKGRFPGQGPRKYYLTGMVFCDCDPNNPKKMKVTKAHDKMKYACLARAEGGCGGRVIMLSDLEKMVTAHVIQHAKDPEVLKNLANLEVASEAGSNAIIESIEKDERRLAILRDQLVDGEEELLATLVGSVRKIESRIQESRDKLARLANATPMIGVDVSELASRWNEIGLDRQRALARLFIDRITIHPTPLRGRFDPTRVEIVPRMRAQALDGDAAAG